MFSSLSVSEFSQCILYIESKVHVTISLHDHQTLFLLIYLLDVRYKFQKDQSYGLSKTSEEKLQSRIPYR